MFARHASTSEFHTTSANLDCKIPEETRATAIPVRWVALNGTPWLLRAARRKIPTAGVTRYHPPGTKPASDAKTPRSVP